MTPTLQVGEFLEGLDGAVLAAYPAPLWIRGEISGLRRTNRGAVFFRLVDPERADQSVEVAARGRVMAQIDRELTAAGVGTMRAGIEARLLVTVGLRRGTSVVQLSLLEIDPGFIAGRLALDRDAILRKLTAEGILERNSRLEMPLVPLRIGLVTSRGSAAHADFLNHLGRTTYRFGVSTVEAMMQGEGSAPRVVAGLRRLARETLDIVVVIRGGGSKLDLATFDDESLARQIADMPVPVLTGIGHETDRSIADEAAAVALKTPTAAAGWIVDRVSDYDRRVDTARRYIRDQAREVVAGMERGLDRSAGLLAATRGLLVRQDDLLSNLAAGIVAGSRSGLRRHEDRIGSYQQLVATVGLEPTLRRGFALVTDSSGATVRSATSVTTGDQVTVRWSDGTVRMTVDGSDE